MHPQGEFARGRGLTQRTLSRLHHPRSQPEKGVAGLWLGSFAMTRPVKSNGCRKKQYKNIIFLISMTTSRIRWLIGGGGGWLTCGGGDG